MLRPAILVVASSAVAAVMVLLSPAEPAPLRAAAPPGLVPKATPSAKSAPVGPVAAPPVEQPKAGATFTPRLKFPEGTVERFVWTTRLQQTMSGGALKTALQQTISETYEGTLTVVRAENGGGVVELHYDRVAADIRLGGARISYDSRKAAAPKGTTDDGKTKAPATDLSAASLTAGYAGWAGTKLTLVFNADGRLANVDGTRPVRDRMAALLPDADKSLLDAAYGAEGVRARLAEMFCDLLAPRPVAVGKGWTIEATRTLPGAGGTKLVTDYKLQGADATAGKGSAPANVALRFALSGTGELTGNPNPDPKVEVKVTTDRLDQTGSAVFDLTRGWVRSRTETRNAAGTITPGVGKAMKLQFQFTTTLTVSPAEAAEGAAEGKPAAK